LLADHQTDGLGPQVENRCSKAEDKFIHSFKLFI